MTTQSVAGAGFPVTPVVGTGIFALAGIGLLAADQSALGVFACLVGFAVSVPLWLREVSGRERHWQARMSAAASASTAAAAATPSMAPSLSRLQSEWCTGMEHKVGAARNQVESAANDIGHVLSQIRDRVQDLSRMASEAGDAMGASGSGVAENVGGTLNDMLGSINQSLEEKVSMFNEVRGFVTATDELARMASSVEELAAKTNLLALNAAIEAARAGEEGRGFSIVADEVRKLSMLSAETGQQIRQRVADISAAARRAGEGADRMQGADAHLLQNAQATVAQVVQSFSRAADPLQTSARQMAEQADQISRDLEHADASLGFQADVGSVLAAIDSSVQALRGQIAAGGDIDVSAIVRPLNERSYSPPLARPRASSPAASFSVAPARAPASSLSSGGASSGGGMDITLF